jgi:hypothetical protein
VDRFCPGGISLLFALVPSRRNAHAGGCPIRLGTVSRKGVTTRMVRIPGPRPFLGDELLVRQSENQIASQDRATKALPGVVFYFSGTRRVRWNIPSRSLGEFMCPGKRVGNIPFGAGRSVHRIAAHASDSPAPGATTRSYQGPLASARHDCLALESGDSRCFVIHHVTGEACGRSASWSASRILERIGGDIRPRGRPNLVQAPTIVVASISRRICRVSVQTTTTTR